MIHSMCVIKEKFLLVSPLQESPWRGATTVGELPIYQHVGQATTAKNHWNKQT